MAAAVTAQEAGKTGGINRRARGERGGKRGRDETLGRRFQTEYRQFRDALKQLWDG